MHTIGQFVNTDIVQGKNSKLFTKGHKYTCAKF